VIVVFVICTGPRLLEVLKQPRDFSVETANVLGNGASKPVGVAPVRNFKGANLRKEPRHNQSNRRR